MQPSSDPATLSDLVTWLREQVDEDELVAQANMRLLESLRSGLPAGLAAKRVSIEDTAYLAGRDPARALREVAAKRAILAEHRQTSFTDVSLGIRDAQVCRSCHGVLILDDTDDRGEDTAPIAQLPFPCPTIRLLLSIYADRPGYREEWRP